MAVSYTTVFTVLGDIIFTNNTYFAYLSTFNTDQAGTESILDAQNVNRFVDGLNDVYSVLRGDVVSWTSQFVERATEILTDYALVTSQFEFGNDPGVQEVLASLIADMKLGSRSVKNSVVTVGSVTKTTTNAATGNIATTKSMDGVSSPTFGAQALPQYLLVGSLFAPDSETLTLTCVTDSETGTLRGSERFSVKGIGPQSEPYSVLGEHVGDVGQLTVGDLGAASYASNLNLDSWSGSPLVPDGWTVASGVAGTDFEQGDTATETLYGVGNSIKIHPTGVDTILTQVLDPQLFQRLKTYFISMWVKDVTGADATAGALDIRLNVQHVPGGTPTTIGATSASHLQTNTTDWSLITAVLSIPSEIVGSLTLKLSGSGSAGGDMLVDQLTIVPIEYLAGIGIAVFGGPDKFLLGDTFTFTLANDCAGLIHTFFRKAYRVQLPVNASPTISDSLVA